MISLAAPRPTPDTFILSATARFHYHKHPGQLSIKTMTNGRAVYTLSDGRRIAVDGTGYLILNERQPYTIDIESPIPMTSFCIFLPDGLAGAVHHALSTAPDALLDTPNTPDAVTPIFFETLTPHNDLVTPLIAEIRDAYAQSVELGWLEERLHTLISRMLNGEQNLMQQTASVSAARPATREELFRRLTIARDFMHASLGDPITLAEIASVAALSPYHFQRAFKQAFGQTPHEYLTQRRIEQAQFLLRSSDLAITDICVSLGFTSLGSFSTLFRRYVGCSPRAYRQYNLRS